jgi:hypothetical protein
LRQILAKMMDGSDLSIQGFDRLRNDEGDAAPGIPQSAVSLATWGYMQGKVVERWIRSNNTVPLPAV